MVANHLANLLAMTGSTWATIGSLQKYLLQKGIKVSNNDLEMNEKLVLHEGYVTLNKINKEENDIAVNALRLALFPQVERNAGVFSYPIYSNDVINRLIERYENEVNKGMKLHSHQKDAVRKTVNTFFSIITGGPGTGKTTVLSCITFVLRELNKEVQIKFTAPTGKAARRIAESTGEYANTTQKEFGITPENDSSLEFEGDVLFIDEISMMDNETLAKVLKSVPTRKKVVLVGDINQLPSVGLGACLRDLIASGHIPTTMLTKTFRQDNSSKLFANIENIKKGSTEIIEGEDYKVYPVSDSLNDKDAENEAFNIIRNLYKKEVEKYGVENVVVLLPYRVNGLGSNKAAKFLQPIANKNREGMCMKYTLPNGLEIFFMKDDYVMQLVNREECANGEIGKVIDVQKNTVTVLFNKTKVTYGKDELKQIMLAYSMTIHKSQGSEYACVIMGLLNEHSSMLQRNLLYTGVTRAKKICHLVYQPKAYETAVSTIADANRVTKLAEKIKNLRMKYRAKYKI